MNTFISYSHKDKEVHNQLKIHLTNLIRNKELISWSDVEIPPGHVIEEKIKEKLSSAELFLLLVSPDFLASSYCIEVELKRAIERHKSGDAIIIPIIIRPCDWKNANFLKDIKVLPTDGEPISTSSDTDVSYVDVVNGIRESINIWNNSKPTAKDSAKQDEFNNNSSIRNGKVEKYSQTQDTRDNTNAGLSNTPDTPRERFLKAVLLTFGKPPENSNQ